jgi:hypothetical protein
VSLARRHSLAQATTVSQLLLGNRQRTRQQDEGSPIGDIDSIETGNLIQPHLDPDGARIGLAEVIASRSAIISPGTQPGVGRAPPAGRPSY